MNENNFEIPVNPNPTGNLNGGVVITENKKSGLLKGVVAFVVLVCLIGGVAYGYNTGIFGGVKYSEENLFSGLVKSFSKINTATTEISYEIKRESRDTKLKSLEKDSLIFTEQSAKSLNDLIKETGKNMKIGFSIKSFLDIDAEKQIADLSVSLTANVDDFPAPISNAKAQIDFIKKGNGTYLQFKEVPVILAMFIKIPLNQWYSLDDSSYVEGTKEFIANYSKNKEQMVARAIEVSAFADSSRMLTFVSSPVKEELNGQSVYRYNLKLRKDGVKDFLYALMDEAKKNPEFLDGAFKNSKKDEIAKMDDVLSIMESNGDVTLITDTKGNPLVWEVTLGIVPPSSITSLNTEQLRLTMKISMSNINMPVTIETPTNVKDISELTGQVR